MMYVRNWWNGRSESESILSGLWNFTAYGSFSFEHQMPHTFIHSS